MDIVVRSFIGANSETACSLWARLLQDRKPWMDFEVLSAILRTGLDVNVDIVSDDLYSTALLEAVRKKDRNLVRFLLRSKAEVNRACRKEHATALHCAMRTDLVEIGRDLLEAKADVNARDSQERTPLLDSQCF